MVGVGVKLGVGVGARKEIAGLLQAVARSIVVARAMENDRRVTRMGRIIKAAAGGVNLSGGLRLLALHVRLHASAARALL